MLKSVNAFANIVLLAASLGSVQAATIAVTASGTGTFLDTLNSVNLQVLTTADVVFAFSSSAGSTPFNCNAIDPTQPATCNGQLDLDILLFASGGASLSEISFSGLYQFVTCGGVSCGGFNGVDPYFGCYGVYPIGNSCALTLDPGAWYMSAFLFDSLVPAGNATVTPWSESVTASLSVNSGSIVISPEPGSFALLMAGCATLVFLRFKLLPRGSR
jgi:hypothetical protein